MKSDKTNSKLLISITYFQLIFSHKFKLSKHNYSTYRHKHGTIISIPYKVDTCFNISFPFFLFNN